MSRVFENIHNVRGDALEKKKDVKEIVLTEKDKDIAMTEKDKDDISHARKCSFRGRT